MSFLGCLMINWFYKNLSYSNVGLTEKLATFLNQFKAASVFFSQTIKIV